MRDGIRSVVGNARSSGYARNADDWYQEPRIAIDMLLDVEAYDGVVWDPACGGGNIPDACKARRIPFLGSDIVFRGWPDTLVEDFLTTDRRQDNIITNPPYNLAEQFVVHALKRAHHKVAVIVRTAFLEGQGRHARLFSKTPPARIWQFAPRISMPPGGKDIPAKGGSIAYCWVIWDKDHDGPCSFGWLA